MAEAPRPSAQAQRVLDELCQQYGLDLEEIITVEADMTHDLGSKPIIRLTYTGIKILDEEQSQDFIEKISSITEDQ